MVVDLGTGAGFPGIVLAIMGKTVHLVESDQRKAAFLREALRVTSTAAEIHMKRIEAVTLRADVITARALAPLPRLLPLAFPLLKPGGMMLLPKGQNVDAELAEARRSWSFVADRLASRSDSRDTVLRLREIDHVEST
jgi:16S rRNA (guanine527-N7)-methyltransferase